MPSARIEAPIAAPISSTSSGSKAAPHASGVGKVAAVQAARPVRHSSCTIAGMPSRVPVTSRRWNSHSHAGPLDRVDRAGAVRPGEVPEPVRG